jgi:hypothetical protein
VRYAPIVKAESLPTYLVGALLIGLLVFLAPGNFRLRLALALVALIFLGLRSSAWAGRDETSRVFDASACSLLVLWAFALYHSVLLAPWLGDDPALLSAVAEKGALVYFTEPSAWRSISGSRFTPWLMVTYFIDWSLFGLSPAYFYVHQLLSLSVVIVLGYFVLSTLATRFVAILGLCVFIASAPVGTIVQFLMNRHYIEGGAFMLLATLCFIASVRRPRPSLAMLGGALYLLASLAKEPYVPMVLVLAFLPLGHFRRRLSVLVPYALFACVYLVWRVWVLGGIAAFGGTARAAGLDLAALGQSLGAATRSLGLQGISRTTIAVLLSTHLLLVILGKRWDRLALILSGFIATALPLVFVAHALTPRMLFVAAFLGSVWLAVAVATIGERLLSKHREVAAGLGSMLLAFALGGMSESWAWADREWIRRAGTEAAFVLNGPAGSVLLEPGFPPWYQEGLDYFRRELLGKEGSVAVCYDPCICVLTDPATPAVKYQEGRMVHEPFQRSGCKYRDVALSVEVRYDRESNLISWTFRPDRNGQWQFLVPSGFSFSVSSAGRFAPPAGAVAQPFAVRFIAAEGWRARSRWFRFGPDGRMRPEVVGGAPTR